MVEKLVKEGKTAVALDMFKDTPSTDPKVLRMKARAQKAGKLVGGALETYDQLTLLEPKAVDVVRFTGPMSHLFDATV